MANYATDLLNTKTILGISLAAVFAVSIIGTAYANPTWLGLSDIAVEEKNNITKLTGLAADDVPKITNDFAGFAWFYADGDNTAIAITTHSADISKPNPFDYEDNNARNDFRDSTQNPDGWHGHNVVLAPGTENSNFCVADLSDAPNLGISFNGDKISVKAKNSKLTGEVLAAGTAFAIQVDADCGPTIGTEGYLGGNGPAPLGIVAAP